MSYKEMAKGVLASIGREIKEKGPRTIAGALQEIRENLPLYDQGHAARSQSAQQATNIESMTAEEKRSELVGAVDDHMKERADKREAAANVMKENFSSERATNQQASQEGTKDRETAKEGGKGAKDHGAQDSRPNEQAKDKDAHRERGPSVS